MARINPLDKSLRVKNKLNVQLFKFFESSLRKNVNNNAIQNLFYLYCFIYACSFIFLFLFKFCYLGLVLLLKHIHHHWI